MNYLELTLSTPAENLACDEALLDACEEDEGPEVLRIWAPAEYFVVLGYANQAALETNLPACEQRRIPVLRRCTGGGTVLQGPGCLNYSLVLKIENAPALQSITETNCFIMKRNAEAVGALLEQPIDVRGVTDLAVGQLKVSGNAQRRRRQSLLFHGAFLLDFDPALMEELLLPPSKQPDYRQRRSHTEFLNRLPVPAKGVIAALRKCWSARQPLLAFPRDRIARLAHEKYSRADWNLKW